MDQGAGKLDKPEDGVRVRSAKLTASGPPEVDEVPVEAQEIERTRNHMSQTIEEIQERLIPERVAEEAKETASEVTEDAKDAVIETVDHVMQEVRTTAEEWSEIARVAALETVDHTIAEAKAALPTVTEQARELAQETIDHAILEAKTAIQDLGEQARLAVRDATLGKVERMAQTTGETTKSFSSTLVTRIKQNPGPAALTGLGIGWLLMSGKGGSSQAPSSSTSTRMSTSTTTSSDVAGQVGNTADQAMSRAGDVVGQAQDAAGKAVDHVQDAASTVTDQVEDAAGAVTDQTRQAASTVTDQAQQLTGNLTTQVQQLTTKLRQTVNQKPLAAGAVALAVGSAAGLMVPTTPQEQQVMGGARDKLVEQAQTSAQGLVEKVQRVASEAGDAAEKELKYQGLTPEQ